MRRNYYISLAADTVKRRLYSCYKIKSPRLRKILVTSLTLAMLPHAFFRGIFNFTIPYLELVLTARCNLRCEGCANLMPLYLGDKPPFDIEPLRIKESVDALCSVSKEINNLVLIGGEVFLYKQLHSVIEFIADNPKIKKITLITNGTVTPSVQSLACLKRDNITVLVSAYPTTDISPFINAIQRQGIKYKINEFHSWLDYGGLACRRLNESELCRSFELCAAAECKTLLNNQIFCCPRSAHANELGIFNERYVVSLKNSSAAALKKELRRLYNAPTITACNYCNPIWMRREIAPAVNNKDRR